MPAPRSLHRNSQRAYDAADHETSRDAVLRILREADRPLATWEIDERRNANQRTRNSSVSATVNGLLKARFIAEVGHNVNKYTGRRCATLAFTGSPAHKAAVEAGIAAPLGGHMPPPPRALGTTRTRPAMDYAAPANISPLRSDAEPEAKPWECGMCGTRYPERFVTEGAFTPGFGEVWCATCLGQGRKGTQTARRVR